MPRAIHRRGNDTGDLRRCVHIAAADKVEPLSTVCPQSRERGDGWAELWLCQSCGWVACSDNSPNQHARAHYEETDHPIAGPLQDDARPRWCYVHECVVRPESAGRVWSAPPALWWSRGARR
jgi:uncharacterized UBP type Zn finger protein